MPATCLAIYQTQDTDEERSSYALASQSLGREASKEDTEELLFLKCDKGHDMTWACRQCYGNKEEGNPQLWGLGWGERMREEKMPELILKTRLNDGQAN